jgi:hypothetical protein
MQKAMNDVYVEAAAPCTWPSMDRVVARRLPQPKHRKVSAACKHRLFPGQKVLRHVERLSQPVQQLSLKGDLFWAALKDCEQLAEITLAADPGQHPGGRILHVQSNLMMIRVCQPLALACWCVIFHMFRILLESL